jgi:hypothetical protein
MWNRIVAKQTGNALFAINADDDTLNSQQQPLLFQGHGDEDQSMETPYVCCRPIHKGSIH